MRRVMAVMVLGAWLLLGTEVQAANAILFAIDSLGNQGGGVLEVNVRVGYSGPDVTGGVFESSLTVLLNSTDSPAVVRQKLSDAIVADATALGLALQRSNILLFEFQKGI
mgnify:CR=1 FL=1